MRIDSPIMTNAVITGSFSGSFTGTGNFEGLTADSVAYANVTGKPALLSGSAQIASDISGSFTSTSSSIASNIASNLSSINTLNGKSLLSGSAQIAADISGSFNSVSASIASDIAGLDSTYATDTQLTSLSSSVASDVASNLSSISTLNGKTLFSSSAQVTITESQISDLDHYTDSDVKTKLNTENVVSGSVTSPSQGTVRLNNVDVDLGVQTGDSPTFSGLTVSNNVTINGDLTVLGDATELQVSSLNVEDINITIASGAADSSAANGAGITIAGANESLTWDHGNSRFNFSDDLNVAGNITLTGTVDGVDIASLNTTVGNIDTSVPAIIDSSGTPAFNTGITKAEVLSILNVEDGADVTDATNVKSSLPSGVVSGSASDARSQLGLGTLATLSSIDISSNTNLGVTDTTGQTGINMSLTGDNISGTLVGLGTSDDVQFDSLGIGTAAPGTTGVIRATNDVVAFYSSDERLKDNISEIPNALDKVEALKGVEFDWNNNQEVYEGHDIGVIAQDVEAVLPELVETRDNGYKAVKYEKLTAVLIQAVKELSAKVKELENR